MADYLEKFALADGVPLTIETPENIVAYDFTNDSPFDLDVAWGIGKPASLTVPPTILWRGARPASQLLISGNQWGGVLVVTPSYPAGGMTPADAPAAQLTVQGYVKGNEPEEQVVSLNRLQNVGNTIQIGGSVGVISMSGETPPVIIIYCLPTGYTFPTWQADDEGNLRITPITNGTQQDALRVIAGDATTYAVVQLDNNRIHSDGRGNLGIDGDVQRNVGTSERGTCGFTVTAPLAGSRMGVFVPFRTVQPSPPASITFGTVHANINAMNPTADVITIYGFRVSAQAIEAGVVSYYVEYNT